MLWACYMDSCSALWTIRGYISSVSLLRFYLCSFGNFPIWIDALLFWRISLSPHCKWRNISAVLPHFSRSDASCFFSKRITIILKHWEILENHDPSRWSFIFSLSACAAKCLTVVSVICQYQRTWWDQAHASSKKPRSRVKRDHHHNVTSSSTIFWFKFGVSNWKTGRWEGWMSSAASSAGFTY